MNTHIMFKKTVSNSLVGPVKRILGNEVLLERAATVAQLPCRIAWSLCSLVFQFSLYPEDRLNGSPQTTIAEQFYAF